MQCLLKYKLYNSNFELSSKWILTKNPSNLKNFFFLGGGGGRGRGGGGSFNTNKMCNRQVKGTEVTQSLKSHLTMDPKNILNFMILLQAIIYTVCWQDFLLL